MASSSSAALQCQLLRPGAKIPTRAHVTDAGYDLSACLAECLVLKPGARVCVDTGVAVSCPVETCFQIWPRSGLALEKGLDVLGGLVDSGYRGEVKVILQNHGVMDVIIRPGDRIAQLVPVSLHFNSQQLQLQGVDKLTASDRDVKGFGSTKV